MPVQSPGLNFGPSPRPKPGFRPQPGRPASRPPQRTWSLNPTEFNPRNSAITIGSRILSRILGVPGLLAMIFAPSDLGADDELALEYRKLAARQSPQPHLHAKPGLKPAYSDADRRKYVAARIKYLFQQGLYGPISVPHGVLGPSSLFAASGLDALLTEDVPFRGGEFVFRDPSNHKRDRSIYIDEDPGLTFRRALGLVKPDVATPPLRDPNDVPAPKPRPVRPLPPFIARPDHPFEKGPQHSPARQPWQTPPAVPKSGTPTRPAEPPAVPEVPEGPVLPEPEGPPVEEPGPTAPAAPVARPSWEEVPEAIPFEREGQWPEIVIEGSIEAGRPKLRVRARLVPDGPLRPEADRKPKRRSGIWALHSFVTNVWGEISDVLELWELMQANMYTQQGTRLAAIRGPLDPVKVMEAWIAGDIDLDEAGFLRDFAVNQLEDQVIGRLSNAVTRGELDAVGGGEWSLTINQRLNSLRRTTLQLGGS